MAIFFQSVSYMAKDPFFTFTSHNTQKNVGQREEGYINGMDGWREGEKEGWKTGHHEWNVCKNRQQIKEGRRKKGKWNEGMDERKGGDENTDQGK